MPAKRSSKPHIGVVGLWHLGSVLCASWSQKGHRVTGLDPDPGIVKNLTRGQPPIFEPDLKESMEKYLRKKTLQFTGSFEQIKDCDYVFLAFDTPVLEDDGSDLSPLEAAIERLRTVLKDGAVVIVSSQTPAGTCARFRERLGTGGRKIECVYSPENLRLGEAIRNYLNPGRIILGAEDDAARKKVRKLFSAIPARVFDMNLASAEMVKHGINSYLATSITFSNALADLCEKTGADILDVVKGMKSDPRIGERSYLTPGIGFSGGTLGRDLKVLDALTGSSNGHHNFFREILGQNSGRKKSILDKLDGLVPGGIGSRRVGILGLTYKPGTSTLRRSLPVEITRLLIGKGASVSVFDPKANYAEWPGERRFRECLNAPDLIRSSEVILLLTEWPEFRSIPWKSLANRTDPQIVFDAKNYLAPLRLERMGYRYVRIGGQ